MQQLSNQREVTFWKWFSKNSDKLFYFELYQDKLLPEALEKIQQIHPDLVFEVGPEIEGKRDFVISANGLKEAFPAVIELARHAPQYDHWNIVAFRQRKDDMDEMEVHIDDIALGPIDLLFNYAFENQKIDLDVYIDDVDIEDERVYHIVFLLLDNMIGEYDVEMKIGRIDIHSMERFANPDKLIELSKLPHIIDMMGHKRVD